MAALSITQLAWENPHGGLGSAVMGLVIGAAPFAYRRWGHLERIVHAVLASAWIALCFIAISSRGAGINAASVGLAELPLFAVLLTGLRGGMVWAAICVGTEVGLAVLGRAGTLVEHVPPPALVFVEYSSLVLITLTLFAVGTMYEVRRQQALAEVEEQDRALREAAVKQAQAETEARMAQAEKLASIGRVTAAVAHEINNPLSCLAMNLRFLRDDMNGGNYDREELASALAESIDGVSRIAHLVARLSGYARHDSAAAAMGAARLDAVVDRAVDLAEPHTRGRAAVRRQMEELPAALGQQGALVDVFVNLIVNAAQALPVERASENQILIHAFRRDPWLVVEVEDNGAGIPSDILPRCGEPFFTTRPIGEGTGLGLAVSRAAVRAVGGKLELESRPGRTVARVLLPVAELAGAATLELAAGALEPAATNGPIAPGVSGLRILIVDDDERVARSLQRVLSAHDVITVSSGRDALELLARRADFDLILCDLMMPGMTGMELYSELAEEYPDLSQRIIFVTGGAFTAGAREFCDRHAARVLGKPVSVEALTRVLLSVAGGRPAAT